MRRFSRISVATSHETEIRGKWRAPPPTKTEYVVGGTISTSINWVLSQKSRAVHFAHAKCSPTQTQNVKRIPLVETILHRNTETGVRNGEICSIINGT